jgi:hypothetical protein
MIGRQKTEDREDSSAQGTAVGPWHPDGRGSNSYPDAIQLKIFMTHRTGCRAWRLRGQPQSTPFKIRRLRLSPAKTVIR